MFTILAKEFVKQNCSKCQYWGRYAFVDGHGKCHHIHKCELNQVHGVEKTRIFSLEKTFVKSIYNMT